MVTVETTQKYTTSSHSHKNYIRSDEIVKKIILFLILIFIYHFYVYQIILTERKSDKASSAFNYWHFSQSWSLYTSILTVGTDKDELTIFGNHLSELAIPCHRAGIKIHQISDEARKLPHFAKYHLDVEN